ncbi:MAG TPA: DUF5719 family protein [Euzebyales bacterium]
MSRQIAFVLTVLALLVGATVAADRVVAAPEPPSATFAEQIDVNSGAWYCVPIARNGETATLTVAAAGEDTSRVTVASVGGGQVEDLGEPRQLEPGDTEEIEIDGGRRPPAVEIRWRGGPATASWNVEGRGGDRLGDSCTPSPAPRWLLSGASTVIGSSTRVYLFNPFDSDAVARVAFATPEGRVNLVSSENLSVPARDVIAVDVSDLQPEQPDLGVIVEVDAGRVIATGVQQFGQPDLPDIELDGAGVSSDTGAPAGRTVLQAQPSDATSAGFAYAAADERNASWITVLNPNTRSAELEVSASDEVAAEAVAQEVVVGPESVERIELEGLSSKSTFGVTVTSTNDVGFVATSFVARSGDDAAVTSLAGIPEADQTSVAATAPGGTGPALALYNAGSTPVTATASASGVAPEGWDALEIAAGEMRLLPFAQAGVTDGGAPVTVSADQPLYATLRLAGSKRVSCLLTLPLVPANTWEGSQDAPIPRRDETLGTRPVDFPAQQDR